MRALFFRKCSNAGEYFRLSDKYPDFGSELEFEIVKTITLDPDDFFHFKNNFLVDDERIAKITKDLYMDESDKVHCAYVTDGSPGGFLVYPSGFNYARYVAYYVAE